MEYEISQEVDIVIIGAGVAGCTAAIAFANMYKIVLVDKLSVPPVRIGECLPPAARRVLKRLDLLEGLESNTVSTKNSLCLKSFGTQSFWGNEKVQIVDHLRNPDGFGWHLDRQGFEMYLREIASQRGAKCVWPAKLFDANYENERWQVAVKTEDGATNQKTYHYSAKFVIDASGRQSHFAKKIGIGRQQFDHLIACWAIMPNKEVSKMSTISACEAGWWYSAPLPNGKRVIALQTDADLVDRDALKNSDTFIKLASANSEMASIFERNHGEIELQQTVAANSTCLNQVAGQQWAALGDAAMSFDPLSSQGMFNAMVGALQLMELINTSNIITNPCTATIHQFKTEYNQQNNQIWEHYCKHKKMFYQAETRWKDAIFWKRRH